MEMIDREKIAGGEEVSWWETELDVILNRLVR